jgi:ribosomal protein RSM22 (predicted rRNA methylase)
MQLPTDLQEAIQQQLVAYPVQALAQAAQHLSARYRAQQSGTGPCLTNAVERAAYLAVRMPATFAAVHRVLSELGPRLLASPSSLLDLGAGSGAGWWAAATVFPTLQRAMLVEQDREFLQLGQALASQVSQVQLEWRHADLRSVQDWPASDLVLCSYSLGELEEGAARRVVRAAWQAAQQALIVVEPGTMRGFATIRALRDELLAADAHLLAPCPHSLDCPLVAHDWCHFAARVARSALQRRLKGGTLGYEDEKFSYLVFTRQPVPPAAARILRHPQHQPGRIQLQLCTAEGVQSLPVTKRMKEQWKRARKVEWGDEWEK